MKKLSCKCNVLRGGKGRRVGARLTALDDPVFIRATRNEC